MNLSALLADVYRRLAFASSPAADVTTRLTAFINETQQEIFGEPGAEFMLNNTGSFASVANQSQYGLPPNISKLKQIRDATTLITLQPM